MSEKISNKDLQLIEEWSYGDIAGWFKYIKGIWIDSEILWKEESKNKIYCYHISTGGIETNETIINAMMKNALNWNITWYQSTKGGHYTFRI